jgi:hypothetical protein
MEKRYFCTLFDRNYLFKGIATLTSLKIHCPTAHVFVLCMDDLTQQVIQALKLPDVGCIPLADLENPALLEAKKTRSVAEYCWTLSPCLPWYVLEQHPEIDLITYIDSDLLFYSSVEPIFEETGANSIAIIEHRFPPHLQHLEVNGRFCVQWVSFRRDDEGMACLSRWRDQCIEWCYYRSDDGRLGDQKYLDEWPSRYPSCHIIQHVGAGTAPWNYCQYDFSETSDGQIKVDHLPLIFYHFHQFQLLTGGRYHRLSRFYTDVKKEPEAVYSRYERSLEDAIHRVNVVAPGFRFGFKPAGRVNIRDVLKSYIPHAMRKGIKRLVSIRP